MKALTDKLATYAPPMWLTAAVAAVAAAMLLSVFVDTLREHLRHGDEFREAQVAAAKRPKFAAMADATTARTEQLKLR
ncbi:hypothetical protein [Roseateles sp. P5_E7]